MSRRPAEQGGGAYPERTVYEITADGRAALDRRCRTATLRRVVLPADPAGRSRGPGGRRPGRARSGCGPRYGDRRDALRAQRAAAAAPRPSSRTRTCRWPSTRYRRICVARARRRVGWHEDVLANLPEILADFDRRRFRPLRPMSEHEGPAVTSSADHRARPRPPRRPDATHKDQAPIRGARRAARRLPQPGRPAGRRLHGAAGHHDRQRRAAQRAGRPRRVVQPVKWVIVPDTCSRWGWR